MSPPYGYSAYVPVAKRRANAAREVARLRKSGHTIRPIVIEGRTIARSFWGKAWCKNLEDYSDYSNRLPRGRTYARNGAILDLKISEGQVSALISGSSFYRVNVKITPLTDARWRSLQERCAGEINSLVELLSGTLSRGVMKEVSRGGDGLFPTPSEISLSCSCPDWADMCKHVAATLYGVGARLDHEPKTLFTLRGVDPTEMVEQAIERGTCLHKSARGRVLKSDDLAGIFGVAIDFDEEAPLAKPPRRATPTANAKTSAPLKTQTLSVDLAGLPPSAVRLFTAIGDTPGLRSPALAAKLNLSKSTVASATRRLKKRGLIIFEGASRNGGYFCTKKTENKT